MILNFKKKEFLIAVLIGVLNLAILVGGGWFITGKIMEASAQLKQKEGYLWTIQNSWQASQGGRSGLDEAKDELAKINSSFVPVDQPIGFINQIESLAQKTNNVLTINLMSLGGTENGKNKDSGKNKKNELSFQMATTGSFANFMHFLKYLENMEYYVRIDSFNISATGGPGGTAEGNVSGIINLTAFSGQ